jgi:putative transposase
VDFLVQNHNLSQRQACQAVNISRTTYLYRPRNKEDNQIISLLGELVDKHPSIGFWKCYHRIRRRGYEWNHKRVYRVYTQMKLNIRRRAKKRLPARAKHALFQPERIDQVWSLDFMCDSLWDGKRYRLLNIIDDYNREVLDIVADTSLPTLRVTRTLDKLLLVRGKPDMIRVDNGPEFISDKLDSWCKDKSIQLVFIQPGKPMQNGFIERLNGSLRRELLNAYIFRTIHEVRDEVKQWKDDYNFHRPHESLNNKTPMDVHATIA